MFTNKKIAIVLTGIILFLLVIKESGILSWYSMSTNTMEPNIQGGNSIFVSNIFEINKDDMVVFETDDFPSPTVFRAVGKEGDTIRIKDGILFVNGQKEEEENKILSQYKVPKNVFRQIKDSDKIFHSHRPDHLIYIDTFLVATKKNFANSLNLEKNIYDKRLEEEEIENTYKEKWNRDNFGPLLISKDKFFVLGDNRGNSYDSRYFGLLDKKDIIGKVLF